MQEFLPAEILAAIAAQYRQAGTAAVRNYETQKADEDSLTGALGGSLAMVEGEAVVDGINYTWRTRSWKVRGRGKGAPESINGADAFLEFEVIDADGKPLRTKVLPLQAKKVWGRKDPKLVEQVRKMQSLCGASLVVDFRPEAYFAIEGGVVLAAEGRRKSVPPDRIKPLGELLADDFLTCKIGAIGLRYDDAAQLLRDANGRVLYASAANAIRTTVRIQRETLATTKAPSTNESERKTRQQRIDPRLNARGWPRATQGATPIGRAYRTEEEETANGPADYALWLDGHIVAVVEAKKLTIGPQNVLTQAARYSQGVTGGPYNFDGHRAPFLYSTNGEVTWFHDVRHPLNRSRRVADFHTPDALRELLTSDFEAVTTTLLATHNAHPRLRPYQIAANTAVEQCIADRRRHLLVAMATGVGKTFTTVNQVYRLMKAGVARRVLFLVDRRALAAQTVRAFSSFEAEPGLKFDKAYEVYSNRFQREDFGDDETFDPKLIPAGYLTKPKPGLAFVYVSTIQRMAINILGREAVFGTDDEAIDDDADKLDIPIHAFDLIVADECHRGYTSGEQSVWRSTLDHFDAIKIGLTATPAAHTTSYFQHLAYRYSYAEAVREDYLVDYDVVAVRSDVRMQGVFLREGEQVESVDSVSGTTQLDLIEDERHFEATEIERQVTAPDSNRKVVEELRRYADAHEQRYGRFPKTLIFAVNDLPHTSHADQLVTMCRDVFGRGDAFVQKITGRVDRPLQRIREFRNRPNPAIAVTVDMLSTGVDIPDLEYIVFLRPVKSRILFEQMLGRGTRLGERFKDKDHFTVFDCFDGTLLDYFRNATGITAEAPDKPTRTTDEIIEDIWSNRDRDYNVGCLIKRLHRIDKHMAGEARELFGGHVPDGDLSAYARGLTAALRSRFTATMKTLRDPGFKDLLVNYPRPKRVFYVAGGVEDYVESRWMPRDSSGVEYKPEDYITAFSRFVRDNPAQIDAIRILLDRPRDWGCEPLNELRKQLVATKERFTVERLQRAHEAHYHRSLVDLISMVKHAADAHQPLLTAAERVERAFLRVTAGETFTAPQQAWLDRIRIYLVESLSIEADDFDQIPIFQREGGLVAARRAFGPRIDTLLRDLNEAIAA